MRVAWRQLVPPRGGWLRLLAAPTSTILLAGLLMTLQGKARILAGIEGLSNWPLWLVWVVSMDVVVYMGLAAVFAAAEGQVPWLRLATYPLSLLVASVALINAWYLSVTGEQLTWESFKLGVSRFTDLWNIATEAVSANTRLALLVGLGLIGLPLAARWYLHKRTGPWRRDLHDRERAHCAAAMALVGSIVTVFWPAPKALPAARLESNAALGTYLGWLSDDDEAVPEYLQFQGYTEPVMVADAEIQQLAARTGRPNVLMLVLESTRYDHTSLAPENRWRGTATPTLLKLAQGGTSASNARCVLPHTTKSLFSMLCGRYPAMQSGIIEYSANLDVQCVPEILASGGYDTAFFQSAVGTFERRPRLVGVLGYKHFESREDIRGEPLGYLGSDDLSLTAPVARWLDSARTDGQPFFVTVLTSATHHPYRLPRSIPANGAETDEERYGRIVAGQDRLLGELLTVLADRGLRDNTIVLVVGDHGEGFGAKGIRQHDTNFYEEGLHVPLVFAGPGVPVRQISRNVTLADIAPTLLGLLGVRVRDEVRPHLVGTDLFAGEVPERTLLFSCWHEQRCRGFVQGTDKVVYVPVTGRGYYFDLASDPDENHPRQIPARLREILPGVNATLDAHRTIRWNLAYEETILGAWNCPADSPCKHVPQGGPDQYSSN